MRGRRHVETAVRKQKVRVAECVYRPVPFGPRVIRRHADDSLAAELSLTNGLHRSAVNRAAYGMFYDVLALVAPTCERPVNRFRPDSVRQRLAWRPFHARPPRS